MDDRNLDHLLAQRRNAPLPAVPANFQQAVWREIRQRKAEDGRHHASWFGWLFAPLFNPGMTVTGLVLALVIGVCLGSTGVLASRETRVRNALDLQVFGSASPSLPSTLIGHAE